MISLAVHLDWRRRSQSQGPLVTRKLLHEMLSKVKGTATPRDQGPGLFVKESPFSPCGFGLLYKQDSAIHSVF
jgi:hypothetical protein